MGGVAGWRGRILEELAPQVAPLTLAADPDGLLLEEALQQAIRERGFELFTFEDHVAFRCAWEAGFRSRRDRGEIPDREVVLRIAGADIGVLPHDLLQAGRPLSFGLGELFPDFAHPVVAALDRSDLDALHDASTQHRPGRLGDGATADFVLRHVFGIDPAAIGTAADLLRVLLRRHYRERCAPRLLDDRLIRSLRQHRAFEAWPLEAIVSDRQAFFAFLQERWPRFLDRIAGLARAGVRARDTAPALLFDGPRDLPFDDGEVRVHVRSLFLDGMLRPVRHRAGDTPRDDWMAAGIRTDPDADRSRRLQGLIESVEGTVPDERARHHDWSAFARRWAELGVLWTGAPPAARVRMDERLAALRARVDGAFRVWLDCRYAGLHNQPPDPPVMVHHLPRWLARRISGDAAGKVALVVVDGLALDQWIVLRDVLVAQRPQLRFREAAVFAWVPTLTSVSRQAIFAGAPPLHFSASIGTTEREPAHWTRFWTDHGLTAREVAYAKRLGDGGSLDDLREHLSRPDMRVLGLVVDKVDRIMHGIELGAAGMHNQVRQWGEEEFLARLLDALLDGGFSVVLTSDHGNVEAQGCGQPSEGALVDIRGARARIYSDPVLRSRIHERFPDAVAWAAPGLPENCLPLLAQARTAFVREGERIVGHGGASIEEVVVPLVEVERTAE